MRSKLWYIINFAIISLVLTVIFKTLAHIDGFEKAVQYILIAIGADYLLTKYFDK